VFRLDGKNAIVTGAGSGIGRAIAITFAAQGARVFILERERDGAEKVAAEIAAAGGAAVPIECDVTNAASVAAAFTRVDRDAARLDILVNNAGIAHVGNVETTAEADLTRSTSKGFICAHRRRSRGCAKRTPA
jgi:2-keto-3-deoxy-L-fuconate dehydrogenase